MFIIAQVSATFVAIVAGFFTTKLISIAGDKKRIVNLIKEKELVIENRQNSIKSHESAIEEIARYHANEGIAIAAIILALQKKPDFTATEVADTIKNQFKAEPTQLTLDLIVSRLDSIKQSVAKMMAFRQENNITFMLTQDSDRISIERDRVETDRQVTRNAQSAILSDCDNIVYMNRQIEQYKKQLSALYYPPDIRFNYGVQIGFAFGGIVIPLIFAYLHTRFKYDVAYGNILSLLFLTIGLILSFRQLWFEIKDVVSSSKNVKPVKRSKAGE